jgi:hypothetical protein
MRAVRERGAAAGGFLRKEGRTGDEQDESHQGQPTDVHGLLTVRQGS